MRGNKSILPMCVSASLFVRVKIDLLGDYFAVDRNPVRGNTMTLFLL